MLLKSAGIDLFQFLIGTLKTMKREEVKFLGKGFQFLIGTLKTRKQKGLSQVALAFQFLIGTLKTE